jgi:hypothetical protein
LVQDLGDFYFGINLAEIPLAAEMKSPSFSDGLFLNGALKIGDYIVSRSYL